MNSPVKLMLLIYFLVFGLLASVDLISISRAEDNIKRSLDRAIDGGIIYGTNEDDYSKGLIYLNEDKVRQGVRDLIQKNLKLEPTLSSEAYQNGELIVNITYHDGVPRVEATFRAAIKMIAGGMVGLDTYPLEITKRTPYLSDYK
ncbi:hypothetical protein [Paenibacillus macquariensis]|uniref:Uncharacterized protein n=1 Tax=Paenibacillus macquariensis TaxID=948756 RepID=A0ABY1KEF8_9BACL|nr:hypothetical protein [Paenibacillus macquariensis]OAB30513.1 hypothetical protein PMSM_22740 [Paenibacillus macquariensis subsp. macquariensis]SIR71167.1 hypothetical protein SAMN05421578_1407 [Paenibacillus macquariensis]